MYLIHNGHKNYEFVGLRAFPRLGRTFVKFFINLLNISSKIEIFEVKIIKLLMEKFNQDFYHYGYTFDTETMTPGGFD